MRKSSYLFLVAMGRIIRAVLEWLVFQIDCDPVVNSCGAAVERCLLTPIDCQQGYCRCHYTKYIPIDDHINISSKKLQKYNFKPLGHYTCMQCGTSHLQTVQENILSHIILATYRKFTLATVRFTQIVSCNIYPRYQQVANVTV